MRTLPPDTPIGRFNQSLAKAMRIAALNFAGKPDDKVQPRLESFIKRIEPHIIKAVGAKQAAKYLDVFYRGVMGHKHEIEAAGARSLSAFLEVLRR
jgi:hypothetical protein